MGKQICRQHWFVQVLVHKKLNSLNTEYPNNMNRNIKSKI